jgi:Rieske Fe-S protein
MRERDRNDLSRRRFLVQLAARTGFVAGGLSACAVATPIRGRRIEGRIVLPHNELEDQLRDGPVVLVTGEDLPEAILLIRTEEGAYRALGARCTHLGCQVRPGKHVLRCPCHGSVFDLAGTVIRGPARKPLARYTVEGTENHLEIVVE